MKITRFLIPIIIIISAANLSAQESIFYIQIEDSTIAPDIVVQKSGKPKFKAKRPELDSIYSKYNISLFEKAFPGIKKNSLKNVYIIKCDDEKLGYELMNKYRVKIPRLEYLCEPSLTYTPNDYGLALGQTNLDLIDAKDAWDIVLGLPKIDIAVTDTYFDLNHEDLNMTLVGGTNNPYSVNSNYVYHGTSVAGCIAAITDNNTGLASVGFDTDLYVSSVFAFDSEVRRLAEAGYRVINCSWINSCTYSTIQKELYDYIRNDLNTVVVFGAGNAGNLHCGNNNPAYPGCYDSNVAVTSVGHMNNIGTTQSPVNNNWKDVHEEVIGDSLSAHKHHPTIDICAPGYNVSTTDIMGSGYGGKNSGNYTSAWGTSFAAPQVSATVGLIISVNPCLSANEAVDILLENTDDSIYDIAENEQYIGRLGTGRLDVYASVSAAAESATTYLEDLSLSGNQNIEDNYAIRVVDNVTIASGANISFITRKEVTIDKNFEVVSGAEFTIDVDLNNSISCN